MQVQMDVRLKWMKALLREPHKLVAAPSFFINLHQNGLLNNNEENK